MPVSLIITTLNEADTILPLLSSIASQTQLPDEIIVTDAGSTDNTIQKIKHYSRNLHLTIHIIKVKGANRSQGRNLAIKKAKHPIIAVTDAGCRLHPEWLSNITKPLHQKYKSPLSQRIAVVAGAYQPVTRTLWQKAAADSASVNFNSINPDTYLPSSRSLAFRKKAWQKVGGYPEHLNTAEDLIFAQRLQKANIKQTLSKSALVYWYPPTNTLKITKQFYNYALGDGLAGLESWHTKKYLIKTTLLIFLAILYFLRLISVPAIITLLILYFFIRSIIQTFNHTFYPRAGLIRGLYFLTHIIWSLILFPTTMIGFWIGLINSIIKSPTKR
jgi:glycosyltransferase involved in cell wall biosynthesis